MNHMRDSKQLEDLMAEASREIARSYAFKIDNLCIITRIIEDGARIAHEEGLQKDSKEKCVEEGGEVDLSHDKEKTIIGLNEEEGKLMKDDNK